MSQALDNPVGLWGVRRTGTRHHFEEASLAAMIQNLQQVDTEQTLNDLSIWYNSVGNIEADAFSGAATVCEAAH